MHGGQEIFPSEMETRHLVFTLRMIYNHLVPAHMRVPGGKRWGDIDKMPVRYLQDSVRHMTAEVTKRPDLTPEHRQILGSIKQGCEDLLRKTPDAVAAPRQTT
jgi:hypothetical protein